MNLPVIGEPNRSSGRTVSGIPAPYRLPYFQA